MSVRTLIVASALLFCTMVWGQTMTMTVTVGNQWSQAKTCEPVVVDLHKAVGADTLSWHVARATVMRDWQEGRGVLEVSDVRRRGQRILAYGPLRTVVEVSDLRWHGSLCCRTRYTLYTGHRYVAVEACFDTPLPEWQRFCTGVQKIGSEPQGLLRNDGIAASWGRDWPDYGKKQLYQEQAVGLAVYVPEEYIYNKVEDSLQYVVVIQAPRQRIFHYWFSCCADMEAAADLRVPSFFIIR